MTIYLVWTGLGEFNQNGNVVAAYTTKEAAEQHIKIHKINYGFGVQEIKLKAECDDIF